jgi:hypothetical protein
MKYSKTGKYKYRLEEDLAVRIPFFPNEIISHALFTLSPLGVLLVKKFYSWDGPSGPTIDTPDFMTPSLVHDVLYQMMRLKLWYYPEMRKKADRLLYDMCRERGMPWWRAGYVYNAVRWFGGDSIKTDEDEGKIYEAP